MKKVIIFAVAAILATVVVGAYRLSKYQKLVRTTTVEDIDLGKVADGVYEGFYDLYLVSARVKVTVENQNIKDIKIIEHKNGKGQKAEPIINDVISKQKVNVNTITGATASSKALLKAIEGALSKGMVLDLNAAGVGP